MSHQKKSLLKLYGVLVLCRMPCVVSDIPVNQRGALLELERRGMAFYNGTRWTRTDKGQEAVKCGVIL